MSDNTQESGPATATALAEPPQPPTVPPGVNATGEAPRPRRRTGAIIGLVVAVVVALALLGVVGYLVYTALRPAATSSPASGQALSTADEAAFDTAMNKAGVKASAPVGPVALDNLQTAGRHHFSATFTPDEIAALLNAFPYASSVAGTDIQLSDVRLQIPEAGSVKISARVNVNGQNYSGTVTLPATFADGHISSTGATSLSAQGFPVGGGQKLQVTDALVNYFNDYLSAAPGLKIDAASIGADGVTASGTAPDSLRYP